MGFLDGFFEVGVRTGFFVVDADGLDTVVAGFSSAKGFELLVGFGRVDAELEGFGLDGFAGFVGLDRSVVVTPGLACEDDEVGFVELLGRLILVGFLDGFETGFVDVDDCGAVSC